MKRGWHYSKAFWETETEILTQNVMVKDVESYIKLVTFGKQNVYKSLTET